MPSTMHSIILIAVMAAITALLRFLPFLIFNEKRPVPKYINWLGEVLPYAVIGMLVIYCMKGVSFTSGSHGIPEILGCVITAALYIWKRNSLISIGGGTVAYMLLVQLVFNA